MAFTEDLSAFFNTDGFGEEFIYKPKAGAALTLVGIFDNAYYAERGGDIVVAGSQPRLQYETAKIDPKPVDGDTITLRGEEYTIVNIEPDGTGVTTLMLERKDDTC